LNKLAGSPKELPSYRRHVFPLLVLPIALLVAGSQVCFAETVRSQHEAIVETEVAGVAFAIPIRYKPQLLVGGVRVWIPKSRTALPSDLVALMRLTSFDLYKKNGLPDHPKLQLKRGTLGRFSRTTIPRGYLAGPGLLGEGELYVQTPVGNSEWSTSYGSLTKFIGIQASSLETAEQLASDPTAYVALDRLIHLFVVKRE
jgi:hypothetical protein